MQHPDEGTIHAWLDGALDAEESARVEAHVAECAECAALVAEARGLIAGASRVLSALDTVPGDVIPPTRERPVVTPAPRRRRWLTPALAAAAAVAFVAIGTTVVMKEGGAPKQEMASSATAPRTVELPIAPPPTGADSTRVATPPPSAGVARAAGEAKGANAAPTRAQSLRVADAAAERRADSIGAASGAASGFAAKGAAGVAAPTLADARADAIVRQRATAPASAPAAATERRMMTVREAEKSAAQPAPSAAPMPARPELQGRFEGCYTIVSGDALGFPTRFVLDTVRVETDAIGERYRLVVPGQRAPGATSWIAMGPVARASWPTSEGEAVLELRVGGTEPFEATVMRGSVTNRVTLKRC